MPPRSRRFLIGYLAVASAFALFQMIRIDFILMSSEREESDAVTTQPLPLRRWAYAFMIAACDPSNPKGYSGFVYNVLVAAYVLRKSGSSADVVLMVQISGNAATTRLSEEEERVLAGANVKLRYLPKPKNKENFHSVIMAKFHVLKLIEYSRVLFLDADVMPLCSLDYFFELSEDGGWLKENMVVAGLIAPANAGTFLLSPKRGDWELAQSIIRDQERRLLENGHFDTELGWGHRFVDYPNDYYKLQNGTRGGNWTWYGVTADQGLLYYWVKYVKRSVSILSNGTVENWIADDSSASTIRLESSLPLPFKAHSCFSHSSPEKKEKTPFLKWMAVPQKDFIHFTGKHKPWEDKGCKRHEKQVDYWHSMLQEVRDDLNMTYLNVSDLQLGSPSAGREPSILDALSVARANLAATTKNVSILGR